MTQDLRALLRLPTPLLAILHVVHVGRVLPVDPVEAVSCLPTHTELPVDTPALTQAPPGAQSRDMENADTRSTTTFTQWRIITSKYLVGESLCDILIILIHSEPDPCRTPTATKLTMS